MKSRLFLTMFLCLVATTYGSVGYAQEKLEKILVGVAGLNGALAHAFIPKYAGLFEKYGLDIGLAFFQGGTQAIQATLSRDYSSPSLPDLRSSIRTSVDRT